MHNTTNNWTTFTTFKAWLNRVCDCRLNIKLLNPDSHRQSPTGNFASGIVSPICHGFGFSKGREHSVISSVSGLANVTCKLAIVWAVSFIVILPVQGQTFLVTIGQCPTLKGPEIKSPFSTDSYATSSPSRIVLADFGVAAFPHTTPDIIKRAISGVQVHHVTSRVTSEINKLGNQFGVLAFRSWELPVFLSQNECITG